MISVVITTFNSKNHISEQLKSIINQSVPANEIIIIDDYSSDDTIELCRDILYGKNFFIIKNKENIGYVKSFEKGLKMAKGDFIFLSDHDDRWKPNKIKDSIEILNETSYKCLFSDGTIMNNDSQRQRATLFSSFGIRNSNILSNQNKLFKTLMKKDFVTGATMVIHKSLIKYILPLPKNIIHDKWIAYVSILNNSLIGTNKKLIDYRVHDKQQVGIKKSYIKRTKSFKYQIYFLETLVERFKGKDDNIFLEKIKLKLEHYLSRKKIVEKKKIILFFSEIFKLNYFRYSSGLLSILRDVLRIWNI